MRMILPRKSLVLPEDFCASNGERPAPSSAGLNPSDSNGLVLSPVDMKRFLPGPNVKEPPVWQQVSRCVPTSNIIFSDVWSIFDPSNTKRDNTFADFSG